MIQRLPYPDEKEHSDPRAEMIDDPLRVDDWQMPGQATREQLGLPTDAPTWWRGEEEASQSFLKAMGVDPAKLDS